MTKQNDELRATLGIESAMTYGPRDSNVRNDIPLKDIIRRHGAAFIRQAVIAGIFGKLGNVSAGGVGKALGRTATDADVTAARQAIIDNWLAEGTWNMRGGGGGDSLVSFMWDAYFAEKKMATKSEQDKERKRIAKMVKAKYGDGESATFGRFLDAVAADIATRSDRSEAELRDALGDKYAKLAKELRDSVADAADEIDAADLDAMLP